MQLLCEALDVMLNAIGSVDRRLSSKWNHWVLSILKLFFSFWNWNASAAVMRNLKRKKNYKSHKYAHLHRCGSNGEWRMELHSSDAVENRRFSKINVVRILFSFFFFSTRILSRCTPKRILNVPLEPCERTKSILIQCSGCTMQMCADRTLARC